MDNSREFSSETQFSPKLTELLDNIQGLRLWHCKLELQRIADISKSTNRMVIVFMKNDPKNQYFYKPRIPIGDLKKGSLLFLVNSRGEKYCIQRYKVIESSISGNFILIFRAPIFEGYRAI